MPFLMFHRQKKAQPISNTNCDALVASFHRPAELELIPLESAQCRPEMVYRVLSRNQHKHTSMRAEPLVWEEPSAPFGGDEDVSYPAPTSVVHSPARRRIPTLDSWLVQEYPSLYMEAIPEEDEEDEETMEMEESGEMEEEVSPMSSTETLVEVNVAQAAAVAAKLEAIVAELPKRAPIALRQTLIPLAVAQARDDIKYRAEGFEMKEMLQNFRAMRSEKVWWKAC